MKITTKIISTLLAVLMLCGSLTCLSTISVVSVSASEVTTAAPSASTTPEDGEKLDYTTVIYATPEEKLATMTKKTSKNGYTFYVDEFSGEVAIKNEATGQLLFTNPYDVATSKGSTETKMEILSQIIVNYSDNGSEKTYTSYEWAAIRDQIKVKNIKNGIRVEYTIGREEARRLVPRLIEVSDFEREIMTPMLEYYDQNTEMGKFLYNKFMSYYQIKSLANCTTERLKSDMLKNFPITEKYDVYVFDPNASSHELEEREEQIKTACPNYTYEELDANHQKTEYQGEDENPPVFKMALEYTIGKNGAISVRLPANGLRFNEQLYQLTNISILPYMGAGNSAYDGYNFYPDGSGALFAFEDLDINTTTTVSGKVYGTDYAYHKITGTYQETIRYPVFGVVEDTVYYDLTLYDDAKGETVERIDGAIYDKVMEARETGTPVPADFKKYEDMIFTAIKIEEAPVSRGYVGILEEGDAMADIATYHAGTKSDYNTINLLFNPRPKDSYNIADAISVGTNSEWTVVSARKYVGSYKIRYIMLTDENLAKEKELPATDYYDATWFGMALAYRDYLENKGILTPLTADEIDDDIPMYIESFGAIETVEKIMSIPVDVMKPLTSFKDVITMYEELSSKGVSNINFKLTGFANGGMYSTVPTKIKWEKAVREDVEFQQLLNYAANLEDGRLGIYPDFEFAYVVVNELFDAVVLDKHAVKSIDDRYTGRRVYSATQQRYMSYGDLAISPAYFDVFYEKLVKNYTTYDNITGISVASLGNALNSDFDEDEPYNREDSKSFVKRALEYLGSKEKSGLDVMVEGGNAYTWQYVNHILGMSLDSSRYLQASYSVPFIGVVLHGYMNFTDSPLNMEGDVNYAKLKAIENGASIYFTLSYDNTEILKEDMELSKYYSIRYDIWYDDVVEIYNELNGALADVQDKFIMDHDFMKGMRVPDTDELEIDVLDEFNSVLDYQQNKNEYEILRKKQAVADARALVADVEEAAMDFIQTCLRYYTKQLGSATYYVDNQQNFDKTFSAYLEQNDSFMPIKAEYDAAVEAGEVPDDLKKSYMEAEQAYNAALTSLKGSIRRVINSIYILESAKENLEKLRADALDGQTLIKNTDDCRDSIKQEIDEQIANIEKYMNMQLGIPMKHTTEMISINTFITTHVALLLSDIRNSNDAADLAKVYFNMMETGAYGLNPSDYELLRQLDANKDMTDDELKAKYSINEDGTGVQGLVLFIRELLGNVRGDSDPKYEFDPSYSDEVGADGLSEYDKVVLNYYLYYLKEKVSAIQKAPVLPGMNFVPTRQVGSKVVSNEANIKSVMETIDTEIEKVLKPVIESIAKGVTEDPAFSLENPAVVTAIDTLVESGNNIITNKNKNKVKYATLDTLDADLRAYIDAYFYYLVVTTNYKPGSAFQKNLHIITKQYKVMNTIELLTENLFSDMITKYNGKDLYKDIWNAALANDRFTETLSSVSDMLAEGYGDVSAQVTANAFGVLADLLNKKKQNIPAFHFDGAAPAELNDVKAYAIEEAKKLDITADDFEASVQAIVDEVCAQLGSYAYTEGNVLADDARSFVYYQCYNVLVTTYSAANPVDFFYDPMIGQVDKGIGEMVATQYAEILTMLTAESTNFDKLEALFTVLAGEEYKVNDYTNGLASIITYQPDTNRNYADDTLQYLISNLAVKLGMTSVKPVDPIISTDKAVQAGSMKIIKQNVNKKVPELVKAAALTALEGCLPNYALSSVMTDADVDAFVAEIIHALESNNYALPTGEAELAAYKQAVEDFFVSTYYSKVYERLGIKASVTFGVGEVYGEDLYTATLALKETMYFYAINYAGLTEEDIESMINKGASLDEEDDDRFSKYLSDDGKIVAVTYGSKNYVDGKFDGTYTPYKTFLLNYNNFAVKVEYEDVEYTISEYGFLTVMHEQE